MKYTYAYKTSDGVRHEDSMESDSREAVFAALRAKGIKAIKVVAADGSKANGEIRGVRKRIVTLIAVLAAAFAGLLAYFSAQGTKTIPRATSVSHDRHQVYGDPALIESIEGDAATLFKTPVDRFLFAYSIPAKKTGDNTQPPETINPDADLLPLEILPDDSRELAEYKQIINGMKDELRDYLKGGGQWKGYVSALRSRQLEESMIVERVRNELNGVTNKVIRDERNAALRAMGLPTIPMPIE